MRRALLPLLLLAGCAAIPTPGAKAQEAARDYNENARFGRLELAMERVSPAYAADYSRTHRAWGGFVHIYDSEMSGMKLTSDHEAQVVVRFDWSRDDRTEVYSTSVRQFWSATLAGWKLDREERVEGPPGLLGESVVVVGPGDAQPRPTRFPTVQIPSAD